MSDSEKRMIKDWIDDLIEIKRRLASMKDYDDSLQSCEASMEKTIQIYIGINKVAESLGLPIKEIEWMGQSSDVAYCIDYNGIKIIQIGD